MTWTYRVAVSSLHQSTSVYRQIIVDGRFVKYINLYIATDSSRSTDHKYKRFLFSQQYFRAVRSSGMWCYVI